MTQELVIEEALEGFVKGRELELSSKDALAMKAYLYALDRCRELFSSHGIVLEEYHFLLHSAARLSITAKNFSKAKALFEESLSLHRLQSNQEGMADDLQELGKLHSRQRSYGKAVSYFQESLDLIPPEQLFRRGIAYFYAMKPLYFSRRFGKAFEFAQKVKAVLEVMPTDFRCELQDLERQNARYLRKLSAIMGDS